jgi:hypothetical protein
MGSDSAFGEPFYAERKCPICGGSLSVNWRGEQQYEMCMQCGIEFTGGVDEDGLEHWLDLSTGEIIRI